ncbi:sugar nucleotide-binding protein [Marinospirillum sp.]|uniref:sugar nucleotide-binding protein n=1 Tax=Marinospirillum sp. TaxID=2183934 RepID=UPI003A89FA0E
MRLLLLSDYAALCGALDQAAQRYPGIDFCHRSPQTQLLTLPDFDFLLLAPLAEQAEVGQSPQPQQLQHWRKNLPELLDLCRSRNAGLLLISSDCVFADQQQGISELDPPAAEDLLAQELMQLETQVAQLEQHLILRTTPLLSTDPTGGLAQLVIRCRQHRAPDNMDYRGLVSLDDLARVLLGMLLQVDAGAQANGLYHYTATEPVSQTELMHTLARLLNTKAYPADLSGTSRLGMNTQHIMDHFGIHPRAWRATLPELLEQLHV